MIRNLQYNWHLLLLLVVAIIVIPDTANWNNINFWFLILIAFIIGDNWKMPKNYGN